MTSLAGYRNRIRLILGDASAVRYGNNLVDEALRQALDDYSKAWPQVLNTTFTVITAGRDQDISSITSLQSILQVIYPYDATVDTPTYFTGYYFTFGSTPTLHISGDSVPAVGDKFYLTYTAPHTIKDLDAATSTSILSAHEGIICKGAAGYSCLMRGTEISEAYGSRASDQDQLVVIGKAYLEIFHDAIRSLQSEHQAHRTITPTAGWLLDDWDVTGYDRH